MLKELCVTVMAGGVRVPSFTALTAVKNPEKVELSYEGQGGMLLFSHRPETLNPAS